MENGVNYPYYLPPSHDKKYAWWKICFNRLINLIFGMKTTLAKFLFIKKWLSHTLQDQKNRVNVISLPMFIFKKIYYQFCWICIIIMVHGSPNIHFLKNFMPVSCVSLFCLTSSMAFTSSVLLKKSDFLFKNMK